MSHNCPGGFITVKIGDRLIELCQGCAEEFIKVARDLEFMLSGKPYVKPVYLSDSEREKLKAVLDEKINDLLDGCEEKPGLVWFSHMSDADLVRLTTDEYIETGTDDD